MMITAQRNTPAEKVARGAAVLDGAMPSSGWAWEVDPSTLEMSNPHRCVLAQLFGEYITGVNILLNEVVEIPQLGVHLDLLSEWGFDAPRQEDYFHLTEAWVAEITRRQSVNA